MPRTPKETFINSVPTSEPSQLTTSANTVPGFTSSTSTTNVGLSVLPGPSSAQTTIVNAPPPSTTTGDAPVPTPNGTTPDRPDNAAPPSPNVIPDLNIRTAERTSPPASTTACACRNDEPHACSTSTITKSSFLDTSSMPPPVTTPNVPMPARPDNTAPPLPDVIPDLNVRTTKRTILPASTNVGACHNDEPPAYSTSTTTKSGFLDTLSMPPSVTTPNVPTPARPDNAAPPSPNVIPDLNIRTTERTLLPPSTNAGAFHNDEPPVCSASTTPKSRFLDTSTMPPHVASMVQQYLPASDAKILPIFPTPLETEVPRAFLVSAYGGASQQWLQIFRKDKHPKGAIERRVVFPQFGLNPAMPSAPGHPGLMFASRHEILEHPPWTMFRKGSGSGGAVWLYLGDYECELVGKMTGTEFSGLAMSASSCLYLNLIYSWISNSFFLF